MNPLTVINQKRCPLNNFQLNYYHKLLCMYVKKQNVHPFFLSQTGVNYGLIIAQHTVDSCFVKKKVSIEFSMAG